jgi:hypothetical protein
MTLAGVNHVPCVESGFGPTSRRAMPETVSWPEGLRLLLEGGDVAWLRRWQAEAVELAGVDVAVRREPGTARTCYELSVPLSLLGDARSDAGGLLWDLAVIDADGNGAEGMLELGTSMWQLEYPVGYARWPGAHGG